MSKITRTGDHVDLTIMGIRARVSEYEKALQWMLHEIRTFQTETLKRQGNTPEETREIMERIGSRKEEYLKT